ncbi:quaternary ammonium compound efflux SMR transporter SugE (plasmid) [Deinococcus sp. KNUC1210]|uniref:quaternary ammonium compound efflux SMR transporter SugE n=1 Tax=Deinococcus sp. KNUC1210 TaxID=2917691 RepID=UPI001EEFC1A3|nr:quaternary ammonium compound efflux SMR transporter SugE [Deinococcus sp. KNUC1210]ULH14305.1 quaternary ammonium compound efflux SMR transporter SugE [Deinococcus sp. KNUC1210]
MAWILLVVAGLLEVGWAVGLKYTEGFTRLLPSILTVLCMLLSVALLGAAARTLPIGTAYGVWVGIGAVGAALLGIVLFKEAVTPARLMFLGLMVVAIIGLKVTGGHH